MLVSRQYNPKVIDKALARIEKIDRKTALLKVEKKNTSGKVNFVVPYDPRFPPINPIVQKHFKVMNEDPHLKRVFQSGVQISYNCVNCCAEQSSTLQFKTPDLKGHKRVGDVALKTVLLAFIHQKIETVFGVQQRAKSMRLNSLLAVKTQM